MPAPNRKDGTMDRIRVVAVGSGGWRLHCASGAVRSGYGADWRELVAAQGLPVVVVDTRWMADECEFLARGPMPGVDVAVGRVWRALRPAGPADAPTVAAEPDTLDIDCEWFGAGPFDLLAPVDWAALALLHGATVSWLTGREAAVLAAPADAELGVTS